MSEPGKFAQMAQVLDEAIQHHRKYRELDEEWLTETARQLRAMEAPIDWPARFRAAAEVADSNGWYLTADTLRNISKSTRPDVVEAIGRALLGQAE
jgi:hypothetical protein